MATAGATVHLRILDLLMSVPLDQNPDNVLDCRRKIKQDNIFVQFISVKISDEYMPKINILLHRAYTKFLTIH